MKSMCVAHLLREEGNTFKILVTKRKGMNLGNKFRNLLLHYHFLLSDVTLLLTFFGILLIV